MQAVVNSLLTNYKKDGNGKKNIVMIHGWADNLDTFDSLAKKLAENYSVYRLDLPGFGRTQASQKIWGLKDYAGFVEQFNKKMGLKNVYAFIGHSNGSAVLIKGFAEGDLKSEKLILLAAAGIRDQQKFKKTILKIVAKTGKVTTFWASKSLKQKLQKKLYGAVGSDYLVSPHLKETFKKTVQEDLQDDAIKIKTKTLLVYGTNDVATPDFYGDIYKNLIKDSELVKLSDANHMLHHDQPEKLAKVIEGFL